MRVLPFAVCVADLVIGTRSPGQAQAPDTLSPAQRAGLALARLGADQRVRIHASGIGRVDGWIVSNSPRLLTLRTDGSQIEIPPRSVDSLWVPGRSHAGKGALIGAVVGGVGLAALGAVRAPSHCYSEFCLGKPASFALGLIVGGAGGALLGAIIGEVRQMELKVS